MKFGTITAIENNNAMFKVAIRNNLNFNETVQKQTKK